jgi:hypothetical protein
VGPLGGPAATCAHAGAYVAPHGVTTGGADALVPQPLSTLMPPVPFGARRALLDSGAQAHNILGVGWDSRDARHRPDGALGRPAAL